jgi:hypothetical protein
MDHMQITKEGRIVDVTITVFRKGTSKKEYQE